MHAPDPFIGQLLADRYRILRTLGEGGMGRVYLAEHERMGRLSAVKVMSPGLVPTPDAISRFNREAANASRINHPNVAAIYDFGETADGTLYLAMEYVEGETLSGLIARAGALPLAEAADITRQVADGLNAAHHLGIVHRDLKPDNILVTKNAEGARLVKVVDFGIAKTAQGGGQTVTTAGMSIGTPEYMSPEQLAGDALDARSDIYSLGLVTFTMLTGETPFANLTSKQSLVQRLTTRPRALEDTRPAIVWPAALQAALDRALSPELHDRYPRVTDFARDVVAATSMASDPSLGRTRAMTPLSTPKIRDVPTELAASTKPVATAPTSRKRVMPLVAGLVVAAGAIGFVAWKLSDPSAGEPAPITTVETSADTVNTPPVRGADSAKDSVTTPAPQPPAPKATVVAPKAKQLAVASPAPERPDTTPSVVASSTQPHPWLAGSGDSLGASLPALPPLASQAREILGHANRARRFFGMQQQGKALPELRTALDEFFVLQSEHPAARETVMLRNQLRTMAATAMSDCPANIDTTNTRDRRAVICTNLSRAVARLSPSGAPGAPLQGRRGQRRMSQPNP